MARAYLLHSSFKVRAQQLRSGRDPHTLPNSATHARPFVLLLKPIRPWTGQGLLLASEPVYRQVWVVLYILCGREVDLASDMQLVAVGGQKAALLNHLIPRLLFVFLFPARFLPVCPLSPAGVERTTAACQKIIFRLVSRKQTGGAAQLASSQSLRLERTETTC